VTLTTAAGKTTSLTLLKLISLPVKLFKLSSRAIHRYFFLDNAERRFEFLLAYGSRPSAPTVELLDMRG
jgi:hypothetical protein